VNGALPEWAAQYVGLPYKTHGRSRAGVDCWGLVELIQREQLGNLWPQYEGADWFKGQSVAVVGHDAAHHATKFTTVIPGEEWLGDGILIRMRGFPFHVALVLAPGWMIHTTEEAGSVIERYRSMVWERRIMGFYRHTT
jgi:cell wall-associated NlpC family hydrolase